MFKRLILATVLVLVASVSYAQGSTVQFVQGNAVSVAQAQSFEYRVYLTPALSITTGAPVLLSNVTCVTAIAPNTFNCTAPLPTTLSGATITGAKSELTAKESATLESGKSAPFIMGANAPSTLKITP